MILYRMKIGKVWTLPDTRSPKGVFSMIPWLFIDEYDNVYVLYWEGNTMPGGLRLRKKVNGYGLSRVP